MITHSYQVDLLVNATATTSDGYWWPGGEGLFIIHGTFAAPDAASFQYRTGQSASFMTYSVINPSTGVPTIVLIDQSCAFNFRLPPCEIRVTVNSDVTNAYVKVIRIPD